MIEHLPVRLVEGCCPVAVARVVVLPTFDIDAAIAEAEVNVSELPCINSEVVHVNAGRCPASDELMEAFVPTLALNVNFDDAIVNIEYRVIEHIKVLCEVA